MSIKALLLVFVFYTMMVVAQCGVKVVAPCSVTCTNGGHTPTCCDAHGFSDGYCENGKAYCSSEEAEEPN